MEIQGTSSLWLESHVVVSSARTRAIVSYIMPK